MSNKKFRKVIWCHRNDGKKHILHVLKKMIESMRGNADAISKTVLLSELGRLEKDEGLN